MSSEQEIPESADQTVTAEPQFALEKIYIKDLSFEAPQGIEGFTQQWTPKVNQDVATKINKVSEERFEVVLSVTAAVKSEEKTLYLVEVQQAGLFRVQGIANDKLAQLLNTQCPNLLFPYAREVVDNTVVKGGFPPLNLPPINFDALFLHAVKQAKEKAEKEQNTAH